ncbi:MAG: PAC2 family protein [Chloroflexi bacterium]|nr:PAC2 family protein [Chloroflexota bacterium]
MVGLPNLIKPLEEPVLKDPYLVAAWPGIGNIGLTSVDYLRDRLEAVEFAEIEPHHFFLPHTVNIERGVFEALKFPRSLFYYKKGERDLIIFVGEMQPSAEEDIYQIANCVLDVAQHFGVKRVFTAGAAVAPIHHTMKSRVWAVPNGPELLDELRKHNVLLMSEIGERGGQGSITGLNGLLLGVAKKRGIDGVCFLGEVPMYVANFPVPYPKASLAILDVLMSSLDIKVDVKDMDYLVGRAEQEIQRVYAALPDAVREQLDKFKTTAEAEASYGSGPITETDKEKIMKDVEEFFGKGKEKQT